MKSEKKRRLKEKEVIRKILSVRRAVLKQLKKLEEIEGFEELDELTRTKGEIKRFGQKLSEMIRLFELNKPFR